MAGINLEELAKNEFWLRKLRTESRTRDTNKDGFLSKDDFRLVIERYKEFCVSEAHLKKLEKNYDLLCATLGIADDSVKLTYDQCIDNFTKCGDHLEEIVKTFMTHFEIIDSNEDGKISFEEWVNYYKAMGIDTVHAKPSFEAMNTNKDGVVSMEEFIAFNKEYYFTAEDNLKSSLLHGPLVD